MSSLLEEAIVDAKALKEAALKNAENAVLEKYSGDVKRALDSLLEQDDLGLGGLEGDPAEGAPSADASFTEKVPFAFQNEELGAPEEEELVEIDFDALKERIDQEEIDPASLMDATEVAQELSEAAAASPEYVGVGDASTPEEGEEGEDEASEAGGQESSPEDIDPAATAAGDAAMKSESLEEDEDIDLTEEMLNDLIEELVVDMVPRPQGWASVNSADNSIEQANNDAMDAAQAAHLEEEEEIEEDAETASDVVPDVPLYEGKISALTESLKELYTLLTESKTQLTQLNLENAKLVYQNKALSSTSLNERQKEKIVEAVQSANSVEEANMIFETIQNAVGVSNSNTRTRPQTLREAVTRPVSLLLNSKKNNEATHDPKMDRMLRLAGLNK